MKTTTVEEMLKHVARFGELRGSEEAFVERVRMLAKGGPQHRPTSPSRAEFRAWRERLLIRDRRVPAPPATEAALAT